MVVRPERGRAHWLTQARRRGSRAPNVSDDQLADRPYLRNDFHREVESSQLLGRKRRRRTPSGFEGDVSAPSAHRHARCASLGLAREEMVRPPGIRARAMSRCAPWASRVGTEPATSPPVTPARSSVSSQGATTSSTPGRSHGARRSARPTPPYATSPTRPAQSPLILGAPAGRSHRRAPGQAWRDVEHELGSLLAGGSAVLRFRSVDRDARPAPTSTAPRRL